MDNPAADDLAGGGGELAGPQYFVLADISGYTAFLNGVERAHETDLSGVMPAGYESLGALLEAVLAGIQQHFRVERIEGDAVFGVARADLLDGRGQSVLDGLHATYSAFTAVRDSAKSATDHVCSACPVIATLDLKYVLHRGTAVRIQTGTHVDLHGPAVNLVHRLLKNSVSARMGLRSYVLITETAALGLEVAGLGLRHQETYPDVGIVDGEIFEMTHAH